MTAKEYMDYGYHLAGAGKVEAAISIFCQAIVQDPACVQAYNDLGVLCRQTGKMTEAEACFRKAVDLQPRQAIYYNNLALVFLDTGRFGEAEGCLKAALELDPLLPELYNSLGLVYEALRQLEAAQAAYCRAIEIEPGYAEAHYNLGTLHKSRQQPRAAATALQKAIGLRPEYAEAKFALATLYLREGRFAEGWEWFDAFRLLRAKDRAGGLPLWQGENLSDKRILLFYDQGFGDTIHFVRYAELIARMGAKIDLWVQEPLQALIQNSCPHVPVHAGASRPPHAYDFACSLMSLPKLLQTTLTTVPRRTPYLKAPAELRRKWSERLAFCPAEKKKVGIVWAGNPKHNDDQNRSVPFAVFSELLVDSVCWVSLQAGKRAEDLRGTDAVLDYAADFTDFAQTAALLEQLDFVITIDSAVAHLAGAMGKETWLLLPFSPDWRWLASGETCIWYPSLRLFRQGADCEWQPVIQRIGGLLCNL